MDTFLKILQLDPTQPNPWMNPTHVIQFSQIRRCGTSYIPTNELGSS